MKLNTLILLCSAIGILLPFGQASAVVSVSTSGTMGYYRDSNQQGHLPLYYNISYSGTHTNGAESSLDLILNNDFTQNNWSVIPSQVMIVYPLSDGFSPWRRSRVQIGRQFFTEGFDISLLDGIQLPVYWSQSGGLWFYGGNTHVMDLQDFGSTPLVGGSVFEEILS